MTARRLLAMSPLAVVAFFAVVAFSLPVLPEPLSGVIFWIFALAWAFALFSVAHPAIRMGPGLLGKAVFGAAIISFLTSVAVQSWSGSSIHEDDLLFFFLNFVPFVLSVVSMGFAVSALETFEGGNGWPFTYTTSNTITAILFLPVGIWFLKGRIQKLLLQTA